MKLDNTISYFDKSDNYQTIIREANKNGYFEQIKQIGKYIQGIPNSFDVNYKKKVHAYYKKKITKPFSLFQQPQYKRQLRFNSDFNTFVKSIPDFQRIKEQPTNEIFQMNRQKEVQSETLIYDAGRKCEVSPENVLKRKMKTVYVKNAGMQNQGVFTTKINLTEVLLSNKKPNDSESRIGIILDTGNRSLSKSSYDSPLSPSKKQQNVQNWIKSKEKQRSKTINLRLLKPRKSNMSIHQSKQKQSVMSSQKFYINQATALQNLNLLTCSDHKLKNFRLSKQKFHQILVKRFGNQIITEFFVVQSIQDLPGILKILRYILTAPPKLAQMLTFLTLDTNRDGVITQDELNYLNNSISVECSLTDDINKIIQYANQHPNLKCNADLPLQFIKQPTYKEYLKICQQNKQVEVGSVRGIYRLFSFKGEKEQKDFGSNFPMIGQRTVDINKKKIRINFANFQKIFEYEKLPNFIQDLGTYLLGKNYRKSEEESPSPRKTNISNKRREGRGRRPTFVLDSSVRQKLLSYNSFHSHNSEESQLSRAHEILGKMHKENKNLATVQYD